MTGNPHLELFRIKMSMLMEQYGQRLRIFVVENKLTGLSSQALKEQRYQEFSRWTFNRDKLKKEIKREVAGLINKIFLATYHQGIKRAK